MTTEALVLSESVESGAIAVRRDPREILAEAHNAAAALKEVLDSKKDPVMMNGERYLEVDDWQTVGRFYGVTAKVESTEFQTYEIPGRDPIFGFDAVAVALSPDGRVISRAEASCLSDEEKWGARPKYAYVYAKTKKADQKDKTKVIADELHEVGYEPPSGEIVWIPNPNKPGKSMPLKSRVLVGTENVPLFQMKSMAQTRASSKVYRQVLAFVPVMAGYKPTPAEEVEGYGAERITTTTRNGTTAEVVTGEILREEPPHPAAAPAPPAAAARPATAASQSAPREIHFEQSEFPGDEAAEQAFHITKVVELKKGSTDKGEWTLYGIETQELGTGQYLSTLDAAIAKAALGAKKSGAPVALTFTTEQRGRFTNRSLTELRVLAAGAAQ